MLRGATAATMEAWVGKKMIPGQQKWGTGRLGDPHAAQRNATKTTKCTRKPPRNHKATKV